MFFLHGVARFLFVPMAEAVMFAMIWSFLLSRTLVPTMAKYLLQPHLHHAEGEGPPPSRNPLVRFQHGFEARFERVRGGYRDLLSMAMRRRPVFVLGFLGFVGLSFLLVPFLGRNFFPNVDSGSDPAACAHPGRHPRRGKRQSTRRRAEARSARSFRRTRSMP